MFDELVKALNESMKIQEVKVGKVSEQLRKDFDTFTTNRKVAVIEGKIDMLTYRKQSLLGIIKDKEVKRLQKELNERADRLNEKHRTENKDLWDRLYKELNLNPEKSYSVDKETGVVTMAVEPPKDGVKH